MRTISKRLTHLLNACVAGTISTLPFYILLPRVRASSMPANESAYFVGPGNSVNSETWNVGTNWEDPIFDIGTPANDFITLTDSLPHGLTRAGNPGGDPELSEIQTLDADFTENSLELGSTNMFVLAGAGTFTGSDHQSHVLTLTGTDQRYVVKLDSGALNSSTPIFYLGYYPGESEIASNAVANLSLSYSSSTLKDFDVEANTLAVTSSISGTGGIDKTGTGTLILEDADGTTPMNTFTGYFQIDGGTVLIGQSTDLYDSNVSLQHGALGMSGVNLGGSNSTIGAATIGDATSANVTIQNDVNILNITIVSPAGGSLIFSGNINMGVSNHTVTVSTATIFAGQMFDSTGYSGVGFIKSGLAALIISGDNIYMGQQR